MQSAAVLRFGTNKEHIRVNSGTEFSIIILISIQCARCDDSHNKMTDVLTGLQG